MIFINSRLIHRLELERMHKPYPFTENRHMQRWIQDMLSRGA